jgi:hypothetical protein
VRTQIANRKPNRILSANVHVKPSFPSSELDLGAEIDFHVVVFLVVAVSARERDIALYLGILRDRQTHAQTGRHEKFIVLEP